MTFIARALKRCRCLIGGDPAPSTTVMKVDGGVTGRRRLLSATSDDNASENACVDGDIQRNGGVIEGVWVFTRHGDRTPTRPLCAPNMLQKEADYWKTMLPTPDPLNALKLLSARFPPKIHHSNSGTFLDVERQPFGFLTRKGIHQMKQNGQIFFARYDELGFHVPDCVDDDDDDESQKGPNHFLQSWDVRAYSTNYLRTILSAQCFLDGLLGTNCYNPRHHLSSMDEPLETLDHSSIADAPVEGTPLVPVEVRNRSDDTLNAFDRNPDLMMKLVANVVEKDDFVARDGKVAPVAARLANFLPGLARKGRKVFGGPSGINWIEATDHFICRTAHGVKFTKFSPFEHDDRAEQTLQALSHQTMTHLAWRFRQWYKSPPLLAAIAAPPLREILVQMEQTPTMGIKDKRPFVVYCCHDVTILALLYGLGADFLANEERGDWRFWPSYATSLVFELVRLNPDSSAQTASHIVRVLLNGKPVKAVELLSRLDDGNDPTYVGTGPMKTLHVQEFAGILTRLEETGGYNREKIVPEGSEAERDMSNWTG